MSKHEAPSALSRWSLSYNLRANVSSQTRDMLMCGFDDEFMSNECSPSRMSRDDADENKIFEVLQRFNVFSMDERPPYVLQNIATNNVVTDDIQASLLSAEKIGQEKLNELVEK